MRTSSLYIHFPFCRSKCYYCDFYSLPYRADLVAAYDEALMREIPLRASEDWGRLSTIYIGGGTPSLMAPEFLNSLLGSINRYYPVLPDCEITLEVNPGTLDAYQLEAYLAAGINRISCGVQSLNNDELKVLGRIHQRDQVLQAIEDLHRAGCKNYGLDLIFGIPGQSLASWDRTVTEVLDLQPHHISCYLLQLDEAVPLARDIRNGCCQLLKEEEEVAMYHLALEKLVSAGFEHYEIANWARPGMACRHNLNYWMTGEYLGLGAGAVSFKDGFRTKNVDDVKGYIRRLLAGKMPKVQVLDEMKPREQAAEAMIMGLRMTRGVDMPDFARRFGMDPQQVFASAIARGRKNGLLDYSLPFLRLTPHGYLLSNLVFLEFL